jgi:RNA recognition motif-containing protein
LGIAVDFSRWQRGTFMGRKLYVGNLPFSATEGELQDLFAGAGQVDSVNIVRDMATGRARGFAFVEMATDEAAQAAINQLHDTQFGGRNLTVNEARPKTPGGGGGGFGGGRGGGGGSRGGGGRREPRW